LATAGHHAQTLAIDRFLQSLCAKRWVIPLATSLSAWYLL
jgi:hypothetical protein